MDEVLMLLGVIAGATWLAYAAFAWNVGRRLKAADRSSLPVGDISGELTVLIPCRNEAEALPHLLNDLQSQSHPVRIVVIDDASTDGTRRAAEAAGVTCIPAAGSGKKSALATGFKHVKTPWMATVDADVRLGADWARNLAATAVHEDAACVLGGVVISAEPSNGWHRFQRLEFAVMQTWIAGGVQSGQLAMGSGANSLYHTQSYPATELREDQASGDDAYALMSIKRNQGRILWNSNSSGRADTEPVAGWSDLWNQRARWASKTNDGSDRETQAVGLVVTTIHLSFIMTSMCIIFSGASAAIGLLVGIAFKTHIDQPLISSAARRYELNVTPSDRFWFSWRYAGLVWGAWWHLLRGQVNWKGRRL